MELVTLFYLVDEFCKSFEPEFKVVDHSCTT